MHIWTHLKKESQGKTGLGIYPDGMVEHDAQVGQLLKKLDDLGIADNTIVMYSTDNGAETFTWPDGGTTPFRGEKATNWEGGYRVPALIRWPGMIKPGTVYNDVVRARGHAADASRGGRRARRQGAAAEGLRGGQHDLQGAPRRLRPRAVLQGRGEGAPRKEFLYWNDDGKLVALRYNRWKLVFSEQRSHGFDVWQEPFVDLRLPELYDLRADPFERASHESIGYRRGGSSASSARSGAGLRRELARELQGVPAAAEAGELQPRPGDAEVSRTSAGRGRRGWPHAGKSHERKR